MKKDALENVVEIASRLGTKDRFLFFDFDGTLSELVNEPVNALPVQGALEALNSAALVENCRVTVISGRMLTDLKRYFPGSQLTLCGSHGAEISGPGIEYRHELKPEDEREMSRLAALCKASFGSVPGFFLENKRYAIAAHYRMADEKEGMKIEGWFDMIALQGLKSVRLRKGKKVCEILPKNAAGKADAINMIAEKFGAKSGKPGMLFAGDDATDTEAFKILGSRAVLIFVGSGAPETADYVLEGPENMVEFISALALNLGR